MFVEVINLKLCSWSENVRISSLLVQERDLKMVQIMYTLYCGVGQGGFRIALMSWKFIPKDIVIEVYVCEG